MAYIKNIKITKTVQNCIHYITDPGKTRNGTLVCYGGTAPECADMIWQGIREKHGKDSKIKAHHFVQSFDPEHGITPEEAQRIGEEVAKIQFGKYGFEYIVATHVDTGVIHNHILVNSVSTTTGKKYHHNNSRDFKKNPNSYIRLRQLNIDICRNYGIPAFDRPKLNETYEKDISDTMIARKYLSAPNYMGTRAYDSWTEKELTNRKKIRADIDEAVRISSNWDEYLHVMREKGYVVKWQTQKGDPRKNVTYVMEGMRRGRRDDSLNLKDREGKVIDNYSRTAIEERIARMSGNKNPIPGKVSGNIIGIRYKHVQIKGNFMFRGFYYGGIRYFVHPKYKIVGKKGRIYYLKRDAVETWYIKRFLKMPEVLIPVGGKSSRLSPREEKRIRKEIDSTIRRCNLISQYGIVSADDTERIRRRFAVHYQILLGRAEEIKKEIAANDRLNDLADIVKKLSPIICQYESLKDEKEKAEFYLQNKYKIQKYNFARRELDKGEYSEEVISSIREKRSGLYAEMRNLMEEQAVYEAKISDMEKIGEQMEGVFTGESQMEKEQSKKR